MGNIIPVIEFVTLIDGELHSNFIADDYVNSLDDELKGNLVKMRFFEEKDGKMLPLNWIYLGTRITVEDASLAGLDDEYYDALHSYMEKSDISSICDTGFDLYPMEDDSITLSEYRSLERNNYVRERK